MSPLLNT